MLACRKPARVRFGRLGTARLGVGYYVYTGSALGRGAVSLEGRLMRHRRRSKNRKWHVDYLTSHKAFRVVGAVYIVSGSRLECRISGSIRKNLNIQPILPHLGASDCNCDGHLFKSATALDEAELARELATVYSAFGRPNVWWT